MKIHRNGVDTPAGESHQYPGLWECQYCTAIVEFEMIDNVKPGWAEGTVESVCPFCKRRRPFIRPRKQGHNQ